MKQFLIRLLVFFLVMSILDRGFGLVITHLQTNAKGGYVGHHNYIIHQTNEDILVFGSSRAIHHYNPQILADSLGMRCYNCGQDGNGIVLFYGWWQLMKDRYHPKMIIYDVTPEFDLLVGDNVKYLGWLRSEYDNEHVKHIFNDIDPTEKYKMISMMYRYNSKFLQSIIDYIHPLFPISSNGYLPLMGEMNEMKLKESQNEEETTQSFDVLKISYLNKFVKETKNENIKLVFVVSPIWYGINNYTIGPIKEICEKEGVPFYDLSNDMAYKHNNKMFKDGAHLNAYGADVFTKEICNLLSYK